MKVREIKECLICGNKNLVEILNLGVHSLSGRFPFKEEADPPEAQLSLLKCDEQNPEACGLLQLKHIIPGDELYMHNYGYRSGLNMTMINHLTKLVKEIEERIKLEEGDCVLDIGSNDATLLKAYNSMGLMKFGIDPTGKQFQKYYPADMTLVPDFFNNENFKRVSEKKAKVITSIAMFYDLADPISFVEDIKKCLDEKGIWISEQSYMPSMLKTNSFDTICHEHLEYYSLKQIKWILNKTGLKLIDVNLNNINGGSFRFNAVHENSLIKSNHKNIETLLRQEEETQLNTLKPYEEFKGRIENVRRKLREFLIEKNKGGKVIHVYGASTKGNTLLQYFNLDSTILSAAAERNPEKFGRRTPRTWIPIISEEQSRKINPDYYLVLPWHFKGEFLKREKKYLDNGGKLIFPLPEFEVIGQ